MTIRAAGRSSQPQSVEHHASHVAAEAPALYDDLGLRGRMPCRAVLRAVP